MTGITELAQSLKAAAEKASDGDWVKESGDGWEAACSANDQANGGFIIAHFEGPDAAENREFVQAANPANILALVEVLEKAQRYAKERDAENQDLMLTVGRLRVEREELESRAVKLPTTRLWAGVTECYEKSDVIAAIRSAGMEVSDD
ncbi:ead/Ea22-like family protein [Klebsiella pneumoniae]|uniref:ead/Ea22-like family protein n=1 Tax=Klebsiella pneumoniae TaxID=573 RepID=UPI0022305C23|nr:ead/Ea22-like family protein [Klebsiella pneumoniae]MDM9354055.1 ead/Ea22-like family protein [Klebsiella pneumoniae]